jgi:hypothetical protein
MQKYPSGWKMIHGVLYGTKWIMFHSLSDSAFNPSTRGGSIANHRVVTNTSIIGASWKSYITSITTHMTHGIHKWHIFFAWKLHAPSKVQTPYMKNTHTSIQGFFFSFPLQLFKTLMKVLDHKLPPHKR